MVRDKQVVRKAHKELSYEGKAAYDGACSGVLMQYGKAALVPVWKSKEEVVSIEKKEATYSRNRENNLKKKKK